MPIINKNIVESDAPVIIHQVNCCKGFGSGVAKAIKEKWQVVADKHLAACEANAAKGLPTSALLGKIQPVTVWENKVIINMFAQDKFGYDGAKYTSYDALDECLKKVRKYCDEHGVKKIALPYKMSSDRGGADWSVVVALIASSFKESDIEIEVCRYNP